MSAPKLRRPFVRRTDAIHLTIRLTPKASRNAIDGLTTGPSGEALIAARVTVVPEKGRANTALLKLLARAWGVAPSRLTLVRGAANRLKTVAIADADADLVHSLNDWANALSGEHDNV